MRQHVSGPARAVLVLVLASGCGVDGSSARVAEDEDPTAAEVVEGGGAVDVAVDAEGRRLVTWYAEPDDDESPGWGAWRLHDAQGEVVADSRFPRQPEGGPVLDVRAVVDGFVVFADGPDTQRVVHVAPSGDAEVVPRTDPARALAGDLLLGHAPGFEARVWSPADQTVHALPRPPRGDVQDVALDPGGVVHLLLPPRGRRSVVLSSPGGAGPWQQSVLPLPPRGETSELAAVGDDVLALTSVRGEVDAVWRLRQGAWTRWLGVPSGVDDEDGGVELARLAEADGDDHLVLLGSQASWVDDGGWRRVEQPTSDGGVLVAGGRLWFRGYVDGDLWSSADRGASWEEVQR